MGQVLDLESRFGALFLIWEALRGCAGDFEPCQQIGEGHPGSPEQEGAEALLGNRSTGLIPFGDGRALWAEVAERVAPTQRCTERVPES